MHRRLVKLQLLIRQPWRNQEGLRSIQDLLPKLGLEITTQGLVSLSAQMKQQDFAKLFHTPAKEIMPQSPRQFDFGRTGGYASDQLPVPPQLQEYIESISVAPPHIRLK